jgi:hypothetical protein
MMMACCLLVFGVGPALGAKSGAKAGAEDASGSESDSDEIDLDAVPRAMPTLEDFGYFLSRMSEMEQGLALNVLADLVADSRLDPTEVAAVLRRLLDEGPAPEDFGYSCSNCFQRRLSGLLTPLRMRGPRVTAPTEGVIALPVNRGLLKKLSREANTDIGGTVPGLVEAMLKGWTPVGKFSRYAYARFHGRGGEVMHEPAFFTSAEALAAHEGTLSEGLDAWALARWLSQRPPRNSFDPGYLVLFFDPNKSCREVRVPTAGDTERPEYRPSPSSEKTSGRTEGGAPEWVCPNFPLTEVTRARYVPHSSYLEE